MALGLGKVTLTEAQVEQNFGHLDLRLEGELEIIGVEAITPGNKEQIQKVYQTVLLRKHVIEQCNRLKKELDGMKVAEWRAASEQYARKFQSAPLELEQNLDAARAKESELRALEQAQAVFEELLASLRLNYRIACPIQLMQYRRQIAAIN